ncbi:hypothetical protein BDF14DRAFT_1770119 [Spinellus fusiger]|nr:hypothetical protein BDF14DRAFT_1770119 [Spinellus fusiger]
MARSLRSQTKKRFRAIKRNNVFKPVEDLRLKRLSDAQAAAAKKPNHGTDENAMKTEEQVTTETATEDSMVEDEKTVSTSGTRSGKQARKLREKKRKNKSSNKW